MNSHEYVLIFANCLIIITSFNQFLNNKEKEDQVVLLIR